MSDSDSKSDTARIDPHLFREASPVQQFLLTQNSEQLRQQGRIIARLDLVYTEQRKTNGRVKRAEAEILKLKNRNHKEDIHAAAWKGRISVLTVIGLAIWGAVCTLFTLLIEPAFKAVTNFFRSP